MQYYDEDGNLIEGEFVKKEDADAASEAAKAAAVEEYKAANPAPEAAPVKVEEKSPAEISADVVEAAVSKALRARDVLDLAKVYAPGDAVKQEEFKNSFGRLSGFDQTQEGLIEQAEMAARAVGIDTAGVDISAHAASGGGRDVDRVNPVAPESDGSKVVGKLFGITDEDRKKYGETAAN